jgi:hypothetical protein
MTLMSFEELCRKLQNYGFDCDPEDLRLQCDSDEELAGLQRNLQKMLKEIEAEARTG